MVSVPHGKGGFYNLPSPPFKEVEDLVKEDIRRFVIDIRKSLRNEEYAKLSAKIRERLCHIDKVKIGKCFLFYYPIKGEPDILPLVQSFIRSGKCIAFPVVEGDEIIAVKVNGLSNFRKGAFGVYEPSYGEHIDEDSIDVVFVPGLAFDKDGFRIGFGKGFYDRFLRKVTAFKIGIAFDFQIFDRIPRDEWDVPVDIVVTPNHIFRRR